MHSTGTRHIRTRESEPSFPVFTGQGNSSKNQMRFRFGEGEELAFVAGIFPLLDENYPNCSSPTSVDSPAKLSTGVLTPDHKQVAARTIAATRSKLRSKFRLERLRREITTLRLELVRLGLKETKLAPHFNNYGKVSKPKWKSVALHEMQLRKRAERDNKALRRMLRAQHLLTKSILNGRVDLLRAIPKMHRAHSPSRTECPSE